MERMRVNGRFAKEGDELGLQERRATRPQRRSCRSFMRARVAEAVPAIVEKFIEEAVKGSIPHANAVMLLVGLTRGKGEPVVKKRQQRDKGLMSILLDLMDAPAVVEKAGQNELGSPTYKHEVGGGEVGGDGVGGGEVGAAE